MTRLQIAARRAAFTKVGGLYVPGSGTVDPADPGTPDPPIVVPPAGGGGGNSPSTFDMIGGDLPGWTYLGGEDFLAEAKLGSFPGTAYSRTFLAHGGEDTSRDLGRPVGFRGMYDAPTTCSVAAGSSVLKVHCYVDSAGKPHVAMLVPMFPAGTASYGEPPGRRYSIVMRCTNIIGNGGGSFKIADLNWPQSNIWKEGEFNWPEAMAGQSNIEGFSHRTDGDPSKNAWNVGTAAGKNFSQWHRYEKEWLPATNGKPARLTYYMDRGTAGEWSRSIPATAVSYGVPLVTMVRRMQFETGLTANIVPAGSECTWEVDNTEEWVLNPATLPA